MEKKTKILFLFVSGIFIVIILGLNMLIKNYEKSPSPPSLDKASLSNKTPEEKSTKTPAASLPEGAETEDALGEGPLLY